MKIAISTVKLTVFSSPLKKQFPIYFGNDAFQKKISSFRFISNRSLSCISLSLASAQNRSHMPLTSPINVRPGSKEACRSCVVTYGFDVGEVNDGANEPLMI